MIIYTLWKHLWYCFSLWLYTSILLTLCLGFYSRYLYFLSVIRFFFFQLYLFSIFFPEWQWILCGCCIWVNSILVYLWVNIERKKKNKSIEYRARTDKNYNFHVIDSNQLYFSHFPFSDVTECMVNETTVLFSITSASCLHGKCGRYGSCYQYISGGFIFSTCVCDAGMLKFKWTLYLQECCH